ncbi:MAG: YebC/PmpR family DNA-binding transcriptional regulator [Oscillospiraceae bacterium]|nr:YebC/PmpR family DNA-binding transcriptional regulator [Oscillospiraceae bacterium]
MGRWQDIAVKKSKTDAARAKVFTRIGREIVVAIKTGGGANPDSNAKLREAIAKAKANNVPNDNINRAIKKADEDASATYDEVLYEGYGPAGVAVIVEATTNNKNRTAAEIRHSFEKNGGNLGAMGSVAFMFERKGVIEIEKPIAFDEDEFMLLALDSGAEDIVVGDDEIQVLTGVADFHKCSQALADSGYFLTSAELQYIPTTDAHINNDDQQTKFDKMVDMLNSNEDVMNIWHNLSE